MIAIRQVTIEDAEAYLNLRGQLDHETKFMMLEPGERQITIEQERERLTALLATDNSMVFLAENDGEPIGFLWANGGMFRRSHHNAHLVIGIRAAFTNQGIGTRLFQTCEAWARERGLHERAVSDDVPESTPEHAYLQALLLALVLFLWTPPHFWSLAIACRADYAAAGVPMLPVVKGDTVAARAIFGHIVLLVAASLAPALFSAGPVYLGGALIGGTLFLAFGWRLTRSPDRRSAIRCFHASLAQLSILLFAAMADGVLGG